MNLSRSWWTAVVVGAERVATDTGQAWPAAPGVYHNPGLTLDLVSANMSAGGVLVLTRPWVARDWRRLAEDRGWTCPPPVPGLATENGVQAWTRWVKGRPAAPTDVMYVGVASLMDEGRNVLFDPATVADAPAEVASLLRRFRSATGEPWRMSAGVIGCGMLRRYYRASGAGRQPLWTVQPPKLGGELAREAGALLWEREPGPADLVRRYAHTWDVRACYLAAMGVVHLPWGELRRYGPDGLPTSYRPAGGGRHARWAGYVRVRMDSLPRWTWEGDSRPPAVNPRRALPDGTITLTTPIMALLEEWGVHPEPVEALLCGDSRRLLVPALVESLKEARRTVEHSMSDTLRAAVKAVWTDTPGMMSRPGGMIYRPDWRALIWDMARANTLRKLNRMAQTIGIQPLKVRTDSVTFASAHADAADAAPELGITVSDGVGGWQHEGRTATADLHEVEA